MATSRPILRLSVLQPLTHTSCQGSYQHDSMYRLLARNTSYDLTTAK